MTKTVEQKYQWELQAYGCTAGAIDNALQDYRDPLMLAASMLSDAQETISPDFNPDGTVDEAVANQARQYMNRAKYIIFKMMKDKQDA
jgi:hypothetical protein